MRAGLSLATHVNRSQTNGKSESVTWTEMLLTTSLRVVFFYNQWPFAKMWQLLIKLHDLMPQHDEVSQDSRWSTEMVYKPLLFISFPLPNYLFLCQQSFPLFQDNMPPTATETIAPIIPSVKSVQELKTQINDDDSNYKYKWALPYANKDVKLPSLKPFEQ